MTTRPDYIRYLESATQAEFEDQLRADGYSVQAEEPYGDVQFDLVARKGAKTIAYEFKAGRSPKNGRESIERLQDAARQAGFEFHIVVVTPPPRVKIEIEDLNQKLKQHMTDADFPKELEALSDRTEITEVYDLRIADIHVGSGEIRLAGMGTVQVELNDQIDWDITDLHEDAFPFRFKAILSADGHLKTVDELAVDTSTFYE